MIDAAANVEHDTTAPWTEWSTLAARVNRMWDPENTPHHSIIGLTGSGKSYLGINGIIRPMCPYDRVLIVDTKGDDPIVSNAGKGVKELPTPAWKTQEERKREDQWWRLTLSDNYREARNQVGTALQQIYKEGNWVIFFDEIRDITDPPGRTASGLGLLPQVDRIYRKGRSKHISIVAATQAPRWVPPSFYDQSSFAWIGRLRDEIRQKRLLEIGGMSKKELPILASLQRRQWLLAADNGEFFARSVVTI